MGEPAVLSDGERDRVLDLARRIVAAVNDDTGHPFDVLREDCTAAKATLRETYMALDWRLLAMAQEIVRLRAIVDGAP